MKAIPVAMLITIALLAPSAIAQDDIRVLQLARFESEADYQAYAEWIDDIENIRFAIVANGKRWTPTVEAWVVEYLQNPASVESNDDVYLITYAEGGLDNKAAHTTLETVVGAYSERMRRRIRREEIQKRKHLDQEFAAVDREADEVLLGNDEESLRKELQELSDRLLKAKMQGAQSEARARALMEYERKKRGEMLDKNSNTEANALRRDLAERKFAEANRKLSEVLALRKNDLVTDDSVGGAEIAVSEAKLELVKLREEQESREVESMDINLQPMLIEAEAERASALALDEVLREHEVRLRKMLDQHRHFIAQKKALELEMRKIDAVRSQVSSGRRAVSPQPGPGAPRLIHPES